ncbi:nucleoside diphosphate kinase regulator [Adhaeribacter radiodurans]|uniref:Nucleoside diphosphate kinase regulator n=1 Tax=Adhaeribacter radiodurans TaxID=2745197 RepID=A0A7L7LAB1_9BACT|nr:nucleoside diphosphate kinase regulator [Adhaeribacter radiodurans]QMU29677.1 nucleoside diphosphate kinase regulator [Adhaeribacter radiodurans]
MNTIYLTEKDYQRLHNLVQHQSHIYGNQATQVLCRELKRAKIVASEEIPVNVITMNSTVRLKELKSKAEMVVTIVYPKEANLSDRKISVLAPVGTAVLGCQVGDKIEWHLPQGPATYKIEEIIYQPEAQGDFHL